MSFFCGGRLKDAKWRGNIPVQLMALKYTSIM